MEKTHKRPVDLPLLKLRLPIGGILSITHRVTGVLLVLMLPVFTWWLQRSLQGEAGFTDAVHFAGSLPARIAAVVVLWWFLQHLVSGVRHLLLDMDLGVDRQAARTSAATAFAVSLLLTAVLATWWLA